MKIILDTRFEQASKWLRSVVNGEFELTQIAGDASHRRFFRVGIDSGSYILMDAPPEINENEAFVRINQLFKKIRTPEIFAVNQQDGFFLEEDFGDETFYLRMKMGVDLGFYHKAIDSLLKLQEMSQPGILPEYSRETLESEMNRFKEWYRGKYLQKSFSDKEDESWRKMVALIVGRILQQNKVYVFRDYHSRNMMILKGGELGMLDYQDALYGPATYDLVSLLKDAYLKLTHEQIEELLGYYQEHSGKSRQQ
ncbi:MAG: phosphotransferase, partial [Microgenomates group bacterium]